MLLINAFLRGVEEETHMAKVMKTAVIVVVLSS